MDANDRSEAASLFAGSPDPLGQLQRYVSPAIVGSATSLAIASRNPQLDSTHQSAVSG